MAIAAGSPILLNNLLQTTIVSSRRLLGPNLFSAREGAVLEVVTPSDSPALVDNWLTIVRDLLARVGWHSEHVASRSYPGGATLFVSAPLDGLMAATEITEQGWLEAEGRSRGTPGDLSDIGARIRVAIAHDRNPRLMALRSAAEQRAVTLAIDDDTLSLGTGTGVQSFRLRSLPEPSDVRWDHVHDVPIALVTGSNGKTTSVRLVAAMVTAAGRLAGSCHTDGIRVGAEIVATGDYSGPAGARALMRDERVEVIVAETARGGVLRRGLAMRNADVALVTNVTPDHFGDYGVLDLETLVDVKLVVAHALGDHGVLVVNADETLLRERARTLPVRRAWFTLDARADFAAARIADGEPVYGVRDHRMVAIRDRQVTDFAGVSDVPVTLGGSAPHNIANALGASAVAWILGVPDDAVRATLLHFGQSPDDNPGRLQVVAVQGRTVVVDFAHNPDGMAALYRATATIDAKRRILVLGQAGDREDAALHDFAAAAIAGNPDIIILKEMKKYLRGRPSGEVTAILGAALAGLGFPEARIRRTEDEPTALRMAMELAEPGDLVLALVHEDLDAAWRAMSTAVLRQA